MKHGRVICAVSLLALFVLVWQFVKQDRRPPVAVAHFHGLIRGQATQFAPHIIGSLGPHYLERQRLWFAAGTNAAVFTISNASRLHIDILPDPQIESQRSTRSSELTSLLSRLPRFAGIGIPPGQVRTAYVAV